MWLVHSCLVSHPNAKGYVQYLIHKTYAPINVKPHPTQYGLCGVLGGDLNLNFAPGVGEFEQTLYSSIDPLQ